MTQHSQGLVIILSGPAGAGKSTFARKLVAKREDCVLSISATTREPRGQETHGLDYFFLSRAEFEAGIKREEFAEYAEFSGNLYGTPRAFVDDNIKEGKNVILDIEVKGASQMRRFYPNAVRIFILPPSPEVLVQRLIDRKTDSREEVSRRMRIARDEILHMEEYDYLMINDDIDNTYELLTNILEAELHRMRGGECERWLSHRNADDVLKVPQDD